MKPTVNITTSIDRTALIDWYRRNRRRTRALFDLVTEDAYYSQPIALRHPLVFYEGHLPAFSFNTLIKRALGQPSIDERLERLFARGIDPAEAGSSGQRSRTEWPHRSAVQAFADEADRQVLAVLAHEDLDRPGHALLDHSEAVYSILEHEAMHHETLLYMWHRLPFGQKRVPPDYVARVDGAIPGTEWIEIPAGQATLGVARGSIRFGWDNEFPVCTETVRGFLLARHDTTNAAFLEFVDGGGYHDDRWWSPEDWAWVQGERIEHPLFWERHHATWYWRGMFELIPLPLSWPVYVSHAEAAAFCRWNGARLPSEAEYQRAAYGTPDDRERPHPWGLAEPSSHHGVFDFSSWDPQPVGTHPAGRSAWGAEDLVGNGWEWTRTTFAPFRGFQAMPSYPEYSMDFFDDDHFVIKGASPATARELLRPTFRNWFRPHYPYVYATFRMAKDLG